MTKTVDQGGMEIRKAGLTGLLCRLGNTIDEATGDRVVAFAEAVRQRSLPGVTDLIPGYATLLVQYDPLRTDAVALTETLRSLSQEKRSSTSGSRLIEIPVCYGGAYGPDLPYVSAYSAMTAEEVIRLHSGREYRIFMLGFLPGFPYLGGLDERLHIPRLETPRVRIPAGSVGIGGSQTGIYPLDSPGGWRLIGRTPMRLFAPDGKVPFRAGDRIRFRPITPEEFEKTEGEHGV